MKIVISDTKTGKSYSVELDKSKSTMLYGKKIGDEIDGNELGIPGYKTVITGGSDTSGFPISKNVSGVRKAKVLISRGVGIKKSHNGDRLRKTVRGNSTSEETGEINTKITSYGAKPIEEFLGKKEKKEEKEEKKD